MNKVTAVILLVFIIIIPLVLGIFLGIYFQKINGGIVAKDNTASILIGNLNTSIFFPIIAHGKVTKSEGGSVILNNNGTELSIKIRNDATINKLVLGQDKSYVYETTSFSNVKIDDTVDIYTEILEDGQIQGSSLTIYPATTTAE
jgi:hypothetical protein